MLIGTVLQASVGQRQEGAEGSNSPLEAEERQAPVQSTSRCVLAPSGQLDLGPLGHALVSLSPVLPPTAAHTWAGSVWRCCLDEDQGQMSTAVGWVLASQLCTYQPCGFKDIFPLLVLVSSAITMF